MSKRSEAMMRRASSPLPATRKAYPSISRTDFNRLQMDRSSSTTRMRGLVWDPEGKNGTFANLTLHNNITAVFNGDLFHKREPQAKSALLTSFLIPTTVKFLENLRAFFHRYTAALVRNPEPHATISVNHIQTYRGAGRTIFNCVGDQIT